MNPYDVKRIKENLFLIMENYAPDNALVMGLIIGSKKAALIDSGMGVFGTELRDVVRGLTDKPVVNILTHGHPDHIAGSVLFDEVYMNEQDESQIPRLSREKRLGDVDFFSHNDPAVMAYAEERCLDCSGFQYQSIQAGDRVNIGGAVLEIYALPGHSAGSIAIYNRAENDCFVGDAFNTSVPASSVQSLSEFGQMADALQVFMDNVPDTAVLYGGHWKDPISWRIVRDEFRAAKELSEGQTADDEDVYLPISPVPHQKRHTHGCVGISYNPAILRNGD